MPRYVWLSQLISEEMFAYGNGPRFRRFADKSLARGDSCNTTTVALSAHLGTHVDLPRHFYRRGKTIDAYRAGEFVFSRISIVRVRAKGAGDMIGYDRIRQGIGAGSDIVIIATGSDAAMRKKRYWADGPGLLPDIAVGIRADFPRVRAVGTDAISISSWRHREKGRAAHEEFLRGNSGCRPLLIIEGMDLRAVGRTDALVRVVVAPLRAASLEACPSTIIGELDD